MSISLPSPLNGGGCDFSESKGDTWEPAVVRDLALTPKSLLPAAQGAWWEVALHGGGLGGTTDSPPAALRNEAPVCLPRPCLTFLCRDKKEVNPPVKFSKLYIHEWFTFGG